MPLNILLDYLYITNPTSGVTPFYNPKFNQINGWNFQQQRLQNLNSEFSQGLYKDLYNINANEFHRYDYTCTTQHTYRYIDSVPSLFIDRPFIVNLKIIAILFRFFLWQQTTPNFNKVWNSSVYSSLKCIYTFFKDFRMQTINYEVSDYSNYEYVAEYDYLFYQSIDGLHEFEEGHGETYLFYTRDLTQYKYTTKWC